MAAGKYNFIIEQGATFQRTFTWEDQGGPLVDLTGMSARLQIKDNDGSLVIGLTTTPSVPNGDVITLGGTAGTITVLITDETTSTFAFSQGRYDLLLTDSQGVTTRLLEGLVNFRPGVTS